MHRCRCTNREHAWTRHAWQLLVFSFRNGKGGTYALPAARDWLQAPAIGMSWLVPAMSILVMHMPASIHSCPAQLWTSRHSEKRRRLMHLFTQRSVCGAGSQGVWSSMLQACNQQNAHATKCWTTQHAGETQWPDRHMRSETRPALQWRLRCVNCMLGDGGFIRCTVEGREGCQLVVVLVDQIKASCAQMRYHVMPSIGTAHICACMPS